MSGQSIPVLGLKKRSEFLAAARGRKAARQTMVVQAVRTPPALLERLPEGVARVGFTVTKKVGNAVERNRVRRRLRAAARETLPNKAISGMDYVLIGRKATLTAPYADLLKDLSGALDTLAKPSRRPHKEDSRQRDKAAAEPKGHE